MEIPVGMAEEFSDLRVFARAPKTNQTGSHEPPNGQPFHINSLIVISAHMLMLLVLEMCCARLHCCFGFGLPLKWRTRRRKKILKRLLLLGYLFCIQTRCNYSWLLIFRQP
jgi:hypothetical protein